jgi:hypothetical protein
MNYTRYLDLHLCTKKDIAAVKTRKLDAARATGNYNEVLKCHRKFFSHGGTEYCYDFRDDMEQQAKYRSNVKSEGFSYDPEAFFSKNIGNCRNFTDVEITQADISMLRVFGGEISNQLKQMRYIGCMVAIEHLQEPTFYPNLEGLMRWICDPTTTNKMRVNCHGSGTTTGGFHMGNNDLSVEAFVRNLARHGLARRSTVLDDGSLLPENAVVVGGSMVVGIQQRAGLAHNARWKLDSEVSHCEAMGCTYKFEKSWYGSSNKHHCRRCGGIFCDKHTSKRIDLAIALTEKSGTVKGAKQVRVCDQCYAEARDQNGIRDAADHDFKYGLQTIALGLCMGAKADERFSPEFSSAAAGALEAGSLAARLRDELTQRNIRGIKITASNQSVVHDEGSGLKNLFGVKYPSKGSSTIAKKLENSGEFSMPATIWGKDPALKQIYRNLPDPKPAAGIVVHDNKVYFGLNQYPPKQSPAFVGPVNQANAQAVYQTLKTQFFAKWEFDSWNKTNVHYSTTTRGIPDSAYILMSPPPRVKAIVGDNPVQTSARDIRVTGEQVNSYKLTKSYGIS